MSTAACVSCQESLSCDDSQLSVTANIVGILTFTFGILFGFRVYSTTMRTAAHNLNEMLATLTLRFREVRHLGEKLSNELNRGRLDVDQKRSLDTALACSFESMVSAGQLLQRLDPVLYDGWWKLWLPAKFRQQEKMIQKGLFKTENSLATLKEAAKDILFNFSPDLAEHEIKFRSELMQKLLELKDGMDNLNTSLGPRDPDATFKSEVLQDLVKIRNELKELKGTNRQVLREIQDMLREALQKPAPRSASA